ncbi:MAG: mate-domain-containing protein [Monoraphidium minutum]|nr:MAG: mate-domain-containing protein [Monoraphidium minutum]
MSFSPGSPLLAAALGATPPMGRSRSLLSDEARRSLDIAVRHTAFVTHAPFDSGLLEGPLGLGAPPFPPPPPGGGDDDAPPLLAPAPPAAVGGKGSMHSTWADAATEARRLLSLALPLVLQSAASMLLTLVSTVFVGRLDDAVALGGVVLASSVYNVSGVSMVIGLSSALDTLCGQAYGAAQYRLMGVYLQRALLICWALCLPIAAIWLNARTLLLMTGQQEDIADIAARYLRILTPSLFIAAASDTCRRYLTAQRVVVPGMAASIATTCLSPLYNWLFIYRLGWRTDGAAAAVLCCNATNAVLINGYRLWRDAAAARRGDASAAWGGFDLRSALSGWGAYLSLGLPAAAMICLEWWVWEIFVVTAGLLPNAGVSVGVMGICLTANSIFYMMPSSLGSATSTRVANFLGAGDAAAARRAFRVAASAAALAGSGGAVSTYLLRRPLVGLFTKEPGTVALALAVMPVMALSLLGDSCVAVLGCVLRAAGRQGMGAALNIFGYWVIGLPLGLALGFPARLGVTGFWVGLATAAGVQAAVFLAVISRFDWHAEVARARAMLAAGRAADGDGGGAAGGVAGAAGSGGGNLEGGGGKAAGDEEEGAAAARGQDAAAEGGDELQRPLLGRGDEG